MVRNQADLTEWGFDLAALDRHAQNILQRHGLIAYDLAMHIITIFCRLATSAI